MYKNWKELIEEIQQMPDCFNLMKKVTLLYKESNVTPNHKVIFKAFKLTKLEDLKVIILGQEPYIQAKISDGLAFSTEQNLYPRSLQIIKKEIIRTEGGENFPSHLSFLAKQGVLLLNTSLTVEVNKPNSHFELWKPFTKRIINFIATIDKPIVWMFWGNHVYSYSKLINNVNKNHLILKSDHPIAEIKGSGKFVGNNHFKLCNEYLLKNDSYTINWLDEIPF